MNADGSALKENEEYLNSIQGKIDKFTNATQTMWNNALDSDIIKGIVDLGTILMKTIDQLGVLRSLLLAIITITMIKNKMGPLEFFTDISDKIRDAYSSVASFKNSITGVSTATAALTAQEIEAAMATGTLSASQAAAAATANGLTLSKTQLNAAEATELLTKAGLNEATTAEIITKLGLTTETKVLTAETLKQALANTTLSASQQKAVAAMLLGKTAATGLAGALQMLKAAFLPLLIVSAIVAGFTILGKVFDELNVTTEELTEELSELKSELSSTQSELKSVEDELTNVRDRMEELLAMPSLSFVEQKELEKLKQTESELESEQKYLTGKEKRQNKQIAEKAAEAVDSQLEDTVFDGTVLDVVNNAAQKAVGFAVAGASLGSVIPGIGTAIGSAIGGVFGLISGTLDGIFGRENRTSTQDKLEREIDNYDKLLARQKELKAEIETADDTERGFLWWKTSDRKELEKELEKVEQEISDTEEYIDTTIGEIGSKLNGVEYGYGADDQLDYYYNISDKWENIYGNGSNAENTINRILSKPQFSDLSDSIDGYVKKLKDGDESAATSIAGLINNSNEFVSALKEAGLEAQDAIDYFTLESGAFDSDTVDGITKQYMKGIQVLQAFKNAVDEARTISYIDVNGEQQSVSWNDLFVKNEDDKWEADATKFSEILRGMDEDARETFMSLAEQVRSGSKTWEQAMEIFKYEGDLAGLEVIKNQVVELNNIYFGDAAEEFNGLIDTVNELHKALDDVASSMDLLNTAQKQMESSGRISITTALDLMEATENWDKVLTVTNGTVKLAANAEEVLIQDKLDHVKANYQTALSEVQTQISALKAKGANEELSMTLDQSTNESVRTLAASMAYLNAMMEANIRLANGESINVQETLLKAQEAYDKTYAALDTPEAHPTTTSQSIEELEAEEEKLKTQLDLLEQIDTVDEFKNYYDYDKKPGDKYDDDDDDEDLLDSIKKKYENKIAMLEAQKQYLENEISRLEAEGEPVSESLYEEQIELEEKKIDLYEKERAELLAAMDTVPKYSEEWYDMADAVWETEHAIQDSTLAIVEMNDAITQLYLDAFDDIAGAHGNKITFLDDQISYIEDYVSYLETLGVSVPDAMYNKLTEIGEKSLKQNYAKLADLEAAEAKAEARIREENGGELKEDDEEWVRLQEEIRQTESDILSAKNQLAEWNKEMREGELDKFDKFMERIDDLESKINNINNLIDDKDIVNDDGTWTEDGITKLGLLYQQMAINEDQATKYSEQIKELQEQYKNEAISEQDYYDRLKELEDAQWDSINAYEESKDAIIDLHEARIDAIKEGIEKEIDAYNELIDVKKKELEAERDLHDFKKDIEEQSKDIATLQRRIASMSGSTDAATIAERTKLEAELRAAQDALNESYYDHSIDSQSDALDDESEAFEKSKNDYIEKLEKTLEDTETLITNTMYTVLGNADIVLENLNTIADERGVILSEELLQPWEDASVKAEEFKNYATAEVSSLINEDGIITTFNTTAKMLFEKAFGSGETAANKFKTQVSNSINIIKTKLETENPNITKYLKDPWNDGVNAANTFSTETGKVLDKLVTNAKSAANQISSYADGIIQDMRNAQAAIDATGGSGNSGNGGNGSGNSNNDSGTGYTINNTQLSKSDVLNLQKLLNALFSGNLTLDGIFGTSTMSALKSAQQKLKNLGYDTPTNGLYNAKTRTAMRNYIQDQINKMRKDNNGSSMIGQAIQRYNTYLSWVPDAYAKGTTNKKDDGWAITDEPQFGDELVMYATPEGRLSYMRAGSTVVPADLTKELMKIGELGISGLQNMGGAIQGINLMSNVINKPEIKLDIENFLHVDNVTQDSLGELKKFAKEQINVMFRQLNYGLK